MWSGVVRPRRPCRYGGSLVISFCIADWLTKDMPRPMIECLTSHAFFKCYYDYSSLVSNYQIYYRYILELSLIWIDHPNTCILWLFIELFVHSI